MGCFAKEDALCGLIEMIRNLRANVRGANRADCDAILEAANDLQMCMFNDGDYGRSELHKVLSALTK